MKALSRRMRESAPGDPADRRWYIVVLVTAAIAISYFDRQTLPIAITAIQRNIPISNEQFSYLQTAFLLAYAALYIVGGRLLDRVGTRRGFMIIMLWWSLACALHGLATDFMLLLCARFLLGMGEGGAFPAAVRVVAEWVPPQQRSTLTSPLDWISAACVMQADIRSLKLDPGCTFLQSGIMHLRSPR